jgi:hypothetical protein
MLKNKKIPSHSNTETADNFILQRKIIIQLPQQLGNKSDDRQRHRKRLPQPNKPPSGAFLGSCQIPTETKACKGLTAHRQSLPPQPP